jgi:GNAT superfamily N-acetyltransferase
VPLESSSRRTVDLNALAIKPLDPQTRRAAFCCGNDRIDNFFRNNARKQHDVCRVRVHVGYIGEEPIGYYYLLASTHPPENVSAEAVEKFGRVKSTPCVYLGMIGVLQECQGNGIGKILMLHAMQKTLEVAELIGIYALTLTAIDKQTADRYQRWGFIPFIEGELDLFIPLGTIRQALTEAGLL